MKALATTLTMACMLLIGCRTTETSTAQRLTESWLDQVSTTLDKATSDQDTATLLAHLASNAVIKVTFPEDPQIPSLSFSRDTYATHLRESWPKTDSIAIRRLSTIYDISPDGLSATATSVFRQTTRMKGADRDIVSMGRQVALIHLIDGVPKARRIDVTVTFKRDSGR